ncbi:GmrSD restriction endonuclease domain-containing protein [Pedococcus soli]
MQTLVLTPTEVFFLPQRLLVPLFQRPYVWSRDGQWSLLWDDIRRQAERRLEGRAAIPAHFLGAVVLQDQSAPAGQLPRRTIIDGQQRLTTLQVAIDAAHAVMSGHGQAKLASQLQRLTANPEDFWSEDEDRFKVWPTNRDRTAYNEVMAAETPVDYASLQHKDSRLVQAHAYFSAVMAEWTSSDGDAQIEQRCATLAGVLTSGLQLVVIELRADEDSQEIFETLNARGTPLSAADLIKNFVFQRLALEGAAAEQAYQTYWHLFETKFWEGEISVGRYLMPRSSLFLGQWLGAQTGEEVSPRATFSRFKHYVEHEMTAPMEQLLPTLHQQATQYQHWVERADDPYAQLTPVEMFVYRTQAMDSEVAKPLLLWLHDPQRPAIPQEQIERALGAVQSWLVRRALLRLASADLGRVVADLISTNSHAAPDQVGDHIAAYLARQDSASTYWPGDTEVEQGLRTLAAYRRFKRGRLRMVLEAAEDHARSFTHAGPSPTGARVPRGVLHIEHLLPQKWQTYWPVTDLEDEAERQEHVHVLGNLTLLTGSLNAKVSNGPWLGDGGKLSHLERHDVILMNRRILRDAVDGWDEHLIDKRTEALIEAILQTWPVPEGHAGKLRDDARPTADYIELKHLVQADAIAVGTVLTASGGKHAQVRGTVLPGGRIQVDGKDFDSPSGSARHVLGRSQNGWTFWRLPDGRRLEDVRIEFREGG